MALFGVPNFLSMPAVGLDISDDAVRFMEFKDTRHGLAVSRYATRNFPLGMVSDGHVRDQKAIHDAIAALASEYKLTFANVSLPEEQAYLVNMKIPRVATKDIRNTIELHLEENVPISGVEALFDYVVVRGRNAGQADQIDAVVSVLPRSAVAEYLEIFHDTGIIPRAFEFESQAMARAIVPYGSEETALVADIGKLVTEIFVVAHGVVQFSASLDFGGHYLTQAIARALAIEEEKAEALKVEYGLLESTDAKEVYRAMLPAVSDLRTRLMRHYSYWENHHSEKIGGNIERVYLTGGGANMRGFPEYLTQELAIPVVIANPWINVSSFDSYVPPLQASESLGYAAAIGLALRDRKPHL